MANRNALVVDDHPTNRLLAATLLKKMGWNPVEAETGEIALALAGTQQFSLVLLDISMPGISGEETCTSLRQMQGEQALHIIAYTAHAFPEERDRFLTFGFDDILVKPISRQRLEALIAKL